MSQNTDRTNLSFIIVRLFELVVVVLGISTILFFLTRLSGDPVSLMAAPSSTPEDIERIREKLGFNDPVMVQYIRFIGRVLLLDFGEPLYGEGSAIKIALRHLPNTLLLGGSAFILAQVISIPLGVFAAISRRKLTSYSIIITTFILQSMPAFWLGIMLIILFSVTFKLLPSYGLGSWQNLILPTITLSAFLLAKSSRLVRASMIGTLGEQYIQTARSKGLGEFEVITNHALRNALIPVITVMGIDLASFLSGAVVTETVFAWPGLGSKLVWAVKMRDYAVMQAIVFIIAVIVTSINLVVDITCRLLDPRIRYD